MKIPVLESLFIKVAGAQASNFIKKKLQHRCFFCEICEIFKNTYFEEHLLLDLFYWILYSRNQLKYLEKVIFLHKVFAQILP